MVCEPDNPQELKLANEPKRNNTGCNQLGHWIDATNNGNLGWDLRMLIAKIVC
jgi:hypothetical protein